MESTYAGCVIRSVVRLKESGRGEFEEQTARLTGGGIMSANSAKLAGRLLATTSVLAISVATAQAQVVTNPSTPFTNTGTINQIVFNDGATHTGDVTNATTGSVLFSGVTGTAIRFSNSTTLNGNIVNNGTVSSTATGAGPHFMVGIGTTGGTVGNITNAGTITVNGQSGGNVGITTGHAGSVTNTGTINVNGTFSTNTVGVNLGTLSGGFTNSGTMNVTAAGRSGTLVGVATGINFLGPVSGTAVNTGTINVTGTPTNASGGGLATLYFSGGSAEALGGFRNDGTVNVQAGNVLGATYIFKKTGAFVNNGTMNVVATGSGSGQSAGGVVLIMNLGLQFAGGIVNNGTMTVTGTSGPGVITPFLGGPAGIALGTGLTGQPALPGGGSVTGGITNNGVMNVNGTTGGAVGIGTSFIVATQAVPFTIDAITNNGTMNIQATASPSSGISLQNFVGGASPTIVGSILNTGTINATNGIVIGPNTTITNGITNTGFINGRTAIDTTGDSVATTINQNGGALNGAVTMSAANADVLNITGGTVNGQITGGATTRVNMTGGTLVVGTTTADSVGTFNQTGGTIAFNVTPNTAVHGSITSINASTRGGIFQAVEAAGIYAPTQAYANVLIAPSSSGTYTVTSVSPAFTAALVPTGVGANRNLLLNFNGFGSVGGLTFNEHAAATGIDGLIASHPTGALATFAGLLAPLNAAQLPAALDAVSGEIHASVQSVILHDSFFAREALLGRLRQITFAGGGTGPMASLGTGGPMVAYAEPEPGAGALAYADAHGGFPIKAPLAPRREPDVAFWAQGIGSWGRINGDGNAGDVSSRLAGFFSGVDGRLGDWRAGIAGGYTNSSVGLSARMSSANIDTAHLGAYAGTSYGAWNLRGGADFAWNTISTSRLVVFPGFTDADSARYNAGEAQVFGEVGYGMAFGRVAAEPFGGLAFVHLRTDSFTEAGGAAALLGTGNTEDVGYTTLGARVATTYMLANGASVTPHASAAWQHAFGDVTPVAALAFQAPGAGFTVAGVPIARDAALLSAGVDMHVGPNVTVGISYIGQLAGNAQDNSVTGTFSWKW